MSFQVRDDYLYCEALRVTDICSRLSESPFYLYSLARIEANFDAYIEALDGLDAIVCYAFKANGNLSILEHLVRLGSGAALVSGGELELASRAGFDPARTILNGNGKTMDELRRAVELGVLINIDSEFDLAHLAKVTSDLGSDANVLVRLNPDIDPDVHPFVATGMSESKFGLRRERLDPLLERIACEPRVKLVGIHCHLGSTIESVAVFREAATAMMDVVSGLRDRGETIRYLNLGGGLGIDYERDGRLPDRRQLIDSIRDVVGSDLTIILEPGRSVIGDAGVLVGRVIGVKRTGKKNFIVADMSMAELIRPSLYGAYHHVDFAQPVGGKVRTFDVVGPVCESADFLAKERKLPTPEEGTVIVVHDAGAYGYAMSSNYNARLRPAEYLVSGDRLEKIRCAETMDDFMGLFP